MKRVVETLRRVVAGADAAEATDAELLERFVSDRDEAAFEALVRRHGPMVLGVCRRILGHTHDAEDAFQATFLVLVRKAATVLPREVLPSWLYSVARQTARKALAGNLRRRARETPVERLPEPGVPPADSTAELAAVLDTELAGLPAAYRVAIVLCDLEGHSGREAARQLGWPEGTLFTRLTRARKLLADRLARRGFGAVPALAPPALAPELLTTTVQAASATLLGPATAAAVVSPAVAILTEGVLQAMIPLKLKFAVAVVAALALLGVGVAGGRYALGDRPTPVASSPAAPAEAPASPAPAVAADSVWVDIGLSRLCHRTTLQPVNCLACHTAPRNTDQGLSLNLTQPYYKPLVAPLVVDPMVNVHGNQAAVEAGLRWLAAQQATQRQQQLQNLADQLDRETLLELLRLVERREATRHAIQAIDQSLNKLREGAKDPRAEAEAIDALLKHLQQRKDQLAKPPEPKKP